MTGNGTQRTLFDFEAGDPFEAASMDEFRARFRQTRGRNPSATDISSYYEKHPREMDRRHGPSPRKPPKPRKR